MMLKSVKRAWRSRGFGIHSPFAFRFVTCVLRGKGRYYAYPAIRQISINSREYRELKVIFRIICDMQPSIILLPDSDSEAVRTAIGLADSRIRTLEADEADFSAISPCPLLYVEGDKHEAAGMADGVFRRQGTVIIRKASREFTTGIKSRLTNGMTFTNGKMTVMVSRDDLPRQDFEINF